VNFVSGATPTNYFEIIAIQYDTNVDNKVWRTTYTLRELTTYTSPVPSIPPVPREGQGSS
jgi:hypothetical protein